jgi:hypothetical protein
VAQPGLKDNKAILNLNIATSMQKNIGKLKKNAVNVAILFS